MFSNNHHSVGSMKIVVGTRTGRAIILEVDSSDTIHAIKMMLREKEGIQSHLQSIRFGMKQLENGYTLSDYNIQEGSTLQLGNYI